MKTRESLSSRLGFIFLAAGCAIGLGNVWRFPSITGAHGGAAFVLIYLIFLLLLATPIMIMEFAVGRASRQSVVGSFKKLQPPGSNWAAYGYMGLAGNYILMMFYTVVSGWMLAYFWFSATGRLAGLSPEQANEFFQTFLSRPGELIFWMGLVTALGSGLCAIGLRNGVERVTKIMMAGLFALMLILVARALTLPGAGAGLSFYLKPDFGKLMEGGFWKTVYAAMAQAFFTLSVGIGSMAVFGSYISRERALTGEALIIVSLDTTVAILSGLLIFPICFSYGVSVNEGPGLIFVTLPNMFNNMPLGRLWGSLFFLFMSFAALSTVLAVFEHLIANSMDILGWSRQKAGLVNFPLLFVLSLPCVLGFNKWAAFQPLGPNSNLLVFEDFIVSANLLPLGALAYLLFCCTRRGWGWSNFMAEANAGQGLKLPGSLRIYFTYGLALILVVVFIMGHVDMFFKMNR